MPCCSSISSLSLSKVSFGFLGENPKPQADRLWWVWGTLVKHFSQICWDLKIGNIVPSNGWDWQGLGQGYDMATAQMLVLVDDLPCLQLAGRAGHILLGAQQLVANQIPLFYTEHCAKFVLQFSEELLCWLLNPRFCLNLHG